MSQNAPLIEMVAELVAAYVGNNIVSPTELPQLIRDIHQVYASLNGSGPQEPPQPLVPAVSVKRSVTPDYIVCLEDGLKFKSLRRHIWTKYGLSPQDYRAKWGLDAEYPMVAPNYAAARSELAKKMGLGQKRVQARKSRRTN